MCCLVLTLHREEQTLYKLSFLLSCKFSALFVCSKNPLIYKIFFQVSSSFSLFNYDVKFTFNLKRLGSFRFFSFFFLLTYAIYLFIFCRILIFFRLVLFILFPTPILATQSAHAHPLPPTPKIHVTSQLSTTSLFRPTC